MSIGSVMPSNHLILCHPLLLLPSVFPGIRDFVQWAGSSHQVAKVLEPQHQSFHLRLTGLISLLSKELSRVFPSTTIQKHQFLVLSLLYGPTLTSIMTMGKTSALTRWTFVGKVMSLLFNTLSRFVINFLPTLKIPPNHTTCIQCYAV